MLLALVGMLSRERVTGDKSEVVAVVGLYWHFVDTVWIVIFPLVYLISSCCWRSAGCCRGSA